MIGEYKSEGDGEPRRGPARHTCETTDPPITPLDQQTQRATVAPQSSRRERVRELNLPDEILAGLSQGR